MKREAGLARVLLLGGDGMLGTAWRRVLEEEGLPYSAPSVEEFDLTRPDHVETGIDGSHPLVINCAGFTDVDGSESQESLAMELNGVAVGQVSRRCAEAGVRMVHYSTDYVFSGRRSEPYGTEDEPEPLNAYGRSKALGEALLRASGGQHLVVRTSWLYASWGENFVKTIVSRLDAGRDLRVVSDQVGRPTSAEHLARTTLRLIRADVSGLWHVAGQGSCSWHEFAVEIAERIGSAARIEACASTDQARAARRPACSLLDLSKTEALLGSMPDWRESLAGVLQEMRAYAGDADAVCQPVRRGGGHEVS